MRKGIPGLLALLVAAVVAAAVSSGSGKASPGAESAFVSPAVAKAFNEVTGLQVLSQPATEAVLKSRVAKYVAVPGKLLQSNPVSKKAAPGKRIALLVCGVPICTEFYNAMKEAAGLLKWKVEKIDLGVSPEAFANAYNRAIELKPDMVVGSGLPRDYFDKQLKKLAQMKTPVIQWSSGIAAVPRQIWVAVDNPLYEAGGIMTAEFLALDRKLKSKVAAWTVPQYSMIEVFVHSVENYLPKICPTCSYDLQQASVTDIGKLGVKVTAYVQQHPETNYVLCGFGDLCQGVGQALKAAGRSDIKVLSRDSATTNFQNVHNGLEYAAMPLPIAQTGWQVIDLAQRIFNGDPTSASRLQPQQILTNVPNPKSPLIGAVPNFKAQYKTLWRLAK